MWNGDVVDDPDCSSWDALTRFCFVVVVLVFVVVGCGACCCAGVCGGGVGVLWLTQC